MKWIKNIFAAVGFAALLLFGLYHAARFAQPEGSSAAGLDQVSVISAEALDALVESSRRIGGMLTWIFVATAVIMQVASWAAAASRLKKVKEERASVDEKLAHLENIEIYFDLPLYLGLLGTVFSFILIALYPDTGLMFAYASTATGIVVSVILRLGYLTPYRRTLIERRHRARVQPPRETAGSSPAA